MSVEILIVVPNWIMLNQCQIFKTHSIVNISLALCGINSVIT